jgi:hypothetical protein
MCDDYYTQQLLITLDWEDDSSQGGCSTKKTVESGSLKKRKTQAQLVGNQPQQSDEPQFNSSLCCITGLILSHGITCRRRCHIEYRAAERQQATAVCSLSIEKNNNNENFDLKERVWIFGSLDGA